MTSAERPRYANPPLIEAVVELQFAPRPKRWDSIYFGKIHAVIEEAYPQTTTLRGTEFAVGGKGMSVGPAPEIKRFSDAKGGSVITVGSDVLGVSVLPAKRDDGHPGWEWLRNESLRILETYERVVGAGFITRVAVRYINGIKVRPDSFRLGDFVNSEAGLVPATLLNERNPFSFRIERAKVADEKRRQTEVLQVAAQPDGPGSGRLILDVDEIMVFAQPQGRSVAADFLDTLHGAVHNVFESFIKTSILDSFGPEQPTEVSK